jgi:hypothetical protein
MRSTLRFIGVGADHNSRAFFTVARMRISSTGYGRTTFGDKLGKDKGLR